MLKIFKNDIEVKHNKFLFPAGEVGFKLENSPFNTGNKWKIVAQLRNSNDFFELAMAQNAIKNESPNDVIDLICPYIPYGRQDRVCVKGEAFSLKVFCNLLNTLAFNTVTIYDPHSDVTPALINKCIVINQKNIIHKFEELKQEILSGYIFVSPDAGANKKTVELAKYFMHKDFIRADKKRNLATGEILETIIYSEDLTGQNVCIADDICDGGKTFIELAKKLKEKNANKVILYVTHGVFSKGFSELWDAGIDKIYTTNSYQDQPLGNYDENKVIIHKLC